MISPRTGRTQGSKKVSRTIVLMNQRGAATLVEVLVAIFIMAIGMITLLTLFPLGLLSMAQAIKDDRTGHAAANATAIGNMWNIRWADNKPAGTAGPYWSLSGGWFNTPPAATYPLLPALTSGPGYPIYVDTIGIFNSSPNTVGALTPTGWPAVSAPGF